MNTTTTPADGLDPSTVADPIAASEVDPIEPAGTEPEEPKRRRRGARRPSTTAAGSTSPRPRKPGRPSNRSNRAERVATLYLQMGGALQMASVVDSRMFPIGEAIEANAAQLGDVWAQWAETSDRVAAMIDRMSFGGGGFAVLLAHLPILKAVMVSLNSERETGALDLLAAFTSGDLSSVLGSEG